jgi:exonuclease VII large subunit
MAEACAEKLGIEREHFKKELEASREELQAQLSAQFADREAALRAEVCHMKEQHELRAKEQEMHRMRMEAEIAEKLEAKMKALDAVSQAAPAQRVALEKQLAKMQADAERQAQEKERLQRQWELQVQDNENRMRSLMAKLEEKDRKLVRARNYDFGTPAGSAPCAFSCLHPRSRNWGNAYGRGRKCVDCKKELGYR